MRRLLLVALREYLENVRTKAFLIAIFMTPLLMAASFLVPALLEQKPPEQRTIALLDTTGVLGADVAARIAARRTPDEKSALYAVEQVALAGADVAAREADQAARRADLDRRVLDGKLFGYLVLRPSALERGDGQAPSEYRTGNLFDQKVYADLSNDVRDVVNARTVAAGTVDPRVARILTTKPPLAQGDVRAATKEAGIAQTAMPFVFVLLLFLTIVTISQALVTNTIEEKSNRVIEVLLSSVSPFQLMAGKIVGTCAVGLTLMAIWATAGLSGLALKGISVVSGGQLGLCLVFYLLGFLFFASFMVAVGSVCNTLKEAQNLLAPVMGVLTMSFMFVFAVMKEPNGTLARVLSMVPLSSPFLMMLRIGSTPPPPAWEVAASIAILAVSAALVMRGAAKVFRVGVLMYGKPPTFRELLRWVRARD